MSHIDVAFDMRDQFAVVYRVSLNIRCLLCVISSVFWLSSVNASAATLSADPSHQRLSLSEAVNQVSLVSNFVVSGLTRAPSSDAESAGLRLSQSTPFKRAVKSQEETVAVDNDVMAAANVLSSQPPADQILQVASLSQFFDLGHYYQFWSHQGDAVKSVSRLNKQRKSGAYIGVGGQQWQFETSSQQSIQLSGYEVQFGARTNDNFGLEFRLGKTNKGSNDDELFGTTRVKLDHMLSVFARPSIALTSKLRAHGVVGYSSIKRTISAPDTVNNQSSDERDGLSYGVGLQWLVNSQISVTLDYLALYDDDDESVEGVSFGLQLSHP